MRFVKKNISIHSPSWNLSLLKIVKLEIILYWDVRKTASLNSMENKSWFWLLNLANRQEVVHLFFSPSATVDGENREREKAYKILYPSSNMLISHILPLIYVIWVVTILYKRHNQQYNWIRKIYLSSYRIRVWRRLRFILFYTI